MAPDVGRRYKGDTVPCGGGRPVVGGRAVSEFEAMGARRGRISERVAAIPPSGIRRFFDLLARTDDVISLGVGEPDFATPGHISEAGIRSIEEGRTGYTSNFGLTDLREAVASHLDRLYRVPYDPEKEILITTGVSEALNVAMQSILDNGD